MYGSVWLWYACHQSGYYYLIQFVGGFVHTTGALNRRERDSYCDGTVLGFFFFGGGEIVQLAQKWFEFCHFFSCGEGGGEQVVAESGRGMPTCPPLMLPLDIVGNNNTMVM